MYRTILPKALAFTVLTAGFAVAGAQQVQSPAPDGGDPAATAPYQHHHHAPNPQRQAEMLTQKLNLTADQTAKIEPILANRDQQLQALHSNAQLAPEDRHQQMRGINKQAEQAMAGVLTPDQMAQLKTMRHEHRHHHDDVNGTNTQTPS